MKELNFKYQYNDVGFCCVVYQLKYNNKNFCYKFQEGLMFNTSNDGTYNEPCSPMDIKAGYTINIERPPEEYQEEISKLEDYCEANNYNLISRK